MHTYITHPVIRFAHVHDELKWFRLWYMIAVVFAGVVLNLGVFTVLVVAHMALDIIKFRTLHRLGWHWTLVETIRESIVDVFFITFGLLLGVAFHHAYAIGGMGRLARLEVILLNLVLRIGPRIKIAEHIMEVVMHWRHHRETPFEPHSSLSRSETILGAATILMLLSLIAVPLYTPISAAELGHTVLQELTPRLELHIVDTVGSL